MSLIRWLAAMTLAIVAVVPTFGCALLSKGKPLEVTWYTPEQGLARGGSAQLQRSCCELRLGRITSGGDLGPRIAYGDGVYQLGYYDGRRWTDRPESYVRRALTRTLFEEGPFQRALTAAAPTLDVEVIAFQEVKTATEHNARIALHVMLASDRVLLERTVVVSRPVTGDRFEAFVGAMAGALDGTAREIAEASHVAIGCR